MRQMMTILLAVGALTASTVVSAQTAVASAGGMALSSGLEVGYTIGQPFVTAATSAAVTVRPGVQQPAPATTSAIEEREAESRLAVFPNPTTDRVSVDLAALGHCRVSLFSLEGRHIETWECDGGSLTINLGGLPTGTYLLQATCKDNSTKTIKISKK